MEEKKKEIKGAGDIIEKVAAWTGAGALFKGMFGKDCGCGVRKQKANAMFPIVHGRTLNGNTRRQVLKTIKPFRGDDHEKQVSYVGKSKITKNIVIQKNTYTQNDVDRLRVEYERLFDAKIRKIKAHCGSCRSENQIKNLLYPILLLLSNDIAAQEKEKPEQEIDVDIDLVDEPKNDIL